MKLFGSVMINRKSIFRDVSVVDGLFLICGLNVLLGLKYPKEHEHFFAYLEKEFLGISRLTHTPFTSQFKKSMTRNLGSRKRAATDSIDDELSEAGSNSGFD